MKRDDAGITTMGTRQFLLDQNRLELLEKRINDYHNKISELIDEINILKEND